MKHCKTCSLELLALLRVTGVYSIIAMSSRGKQKPKQLLELLPVPKTPLSVLS